jgi:predicted NBD/HSP70 family sugar kinase
MNDRERDLLNQVWRHPGVSRKDLSMGLGLHPNLVSDAIRELIQTEWIVESGAKKAGAGRTPIALQLHPQKQASFAVSYDLRSLVCALVNANGETLQKVETPHSTRDPGKLAEMIVRIFTRMKHGYAGHVIGIGIADPGMVDSVAGEVVRSVFFPGWSHVPMARLIAEKTGLTVSLDDCTRTRATAQYRITLELQQKHDSMLYLDYGEGLGFAVVTPNGLWRGAGFAGEVGHVVADPEGALCRCGASGCLENLANSLALESKACDLLARGVNSSLQGKKKISSEAIFAAALDGDRTARSAVRAIMQPLGMAISFLTAAFHPRFLVVGAETRAAIQCLRKELQAVLENRILTEIASTIEVIEGQESRPLTLTGAGLMVFEKTFKGEGSSRS